MTRGAAGLSGADHEMVTAAKQGIDWNGDRDLSTIRAPIRDGHTGIDVAVNLLRVTGDPCAELAAHRRSWSWTTPTAECCRREVDTVRSSPITTQTCGVVVPHQEPG